MLNRTYPENLFLFFENLMVWEKNMFPYYEMGDIKVDGKLVK